MTIGSGNDRGAVAAGIGIATCLLIAIVFGVAAERSSAADLACGDVVIADTTLQADLTCSGDGLIIGADDITVDLGGHTIQATCSVGPCPVTSGIDNAGYDHVRIVNGTVKSFERGILLDGADHNKLSNLFVAGGGGGRGDSRAVLLNDSDGNRIEDSALEDGNPALLLSASDDNTMSRISVDGGIAIHVGGGVKLVEGSDYNRILDSDIGGIAGGTSISQSRGNDFRRSSSSSYYADFVLDQADKTTISRSTLPHAGPFAPSLVASDSDRIRVVHNVADGSAFSVDGDRNRIASNEASVMSITGNRNRIAHNGVSYKEDPSLPALLVESGRHNAAVGNHSTEGGFISVAAEATHTLLARNLVTNGYSDGFLVEAPGTIVRRNTANDNAELGINAVAGVIDGGRNHASGNGNPLQCVNVVCRP